MLEFEYPWVLFLAPLPLLVWLLAPPYRDRRQALRIPFFDEIAPVVGEKPQPGAVVMRKNWLQRIVSPIAWLLVLGAAARPVWVEDPIEKIQSGRDLLLAVDVSQSMEARDFTNPEGQRVDRLTAVKDVVDEFIARREGDRIGLVVFGGGAYPQAPFTLDHDAVRLLLDETGIGMAGPQTVIGDAIGLGIKLFESSEVEEKTLVLLTDGNDTGSKMPPMKAAEIAEREGIVVHTIGIGDPEASGEDGVDLEALQTLAQATGGQAFRGEDRAGLEDIYRTLDEIVPDEFETLSFRPKRPLFQWPFGVAALLALLYHVVAAVAAFLRKSTSKVATRLSEEGAADA